MNILVTEKNASLIARELSRRFVNQFCKDGHKNVLCKKSRKNGCSKDQRLTITMTTSPSPTRRDGRRRGSEYVTIFYAFTNRHLRKYQHFVNR